MNRRNRKMRPRRRSHNRFIRLEALEPRVVLDGSASLGFITPTQNAVIDLDGTDGLGNYQVNVYTSNRGSDQFSRDLSALVPLHTKFDFSVFLDVAIEFESSRDNLGYRFYEDRGLNVADGSAITNEWNVVSAGTDSELYIGLEDQADSRLQPIVDVLRRAMEVGRDAPDVIIINDHLSSNAPTFVVAGPLRDQVVLDDPVVIPAPAPASGLLPIEMAPRAGVGSIAAAPTEFGSSEPIPGAGWATCW